MEATQVADFMTTMRTTARIRFSPSSFLALQGLHQVVLGVAVLLVSAILALDGGWNSWLLPVLVVLVVLGWWRICVYYDGFGQAQVRSPAGFWGAGRPFLARLLFWVPALALTVAFPILSQPGYMLGVAFLGFFVTEKRPWYYLLFSLSFFASAILGRSMRHILFLPPDLLLLSLALVITGVLDHLRLLRTSVATRPEPGAF
jgi:hypothetical protein